MFRRDDGHLTRSTVRNLSRAHRLLYRWTGGRLGRRLVDNDMILLTTTGARTGSEHTVPLLALRDGRSLVVIASYGGRHHHPDWFHNLVARPAARVQDGGERFDVIARVAGDAERDHWWPRAVEAYDGYRGYQELTDREIPVVVLDPA